MKRSLLLFSCLFNCQTYFSQLSGTISVPSASYTSLATVITALNQQTVSTPIIINIAAGYSETAPVGGYSLTASGSQSAQIIFQKSGTGANPIITAYSGGSGTPGSMNQDGFFRLIGCDFITIDGIDLMDTNSANPASMEFGFALFKADAANGCWNNTIKNCNISLRRVNNASGSGPAADGSRGIDVVNAYSSVHNSAITVSASAGSHSFNKFQSNTIQQCNIPVSLVGFADVSPYTFADQGNEIGGNSISTGNTLVNFGGGGTVSASTGVRTVAQYDLLISYNTINNNTGNGVNHGVTLRGIQLNNAAGANATISNNTITLNGGGQNSQFSVIENASGSGSSTNTISIHHNLIHNCTYTSAVSPGYYGIWNYASPSVLSVSHNSFVNNSSHASAGSTYLIYNSGAVSNSIVISNNQMGFIFSGANAYSGTFYSISNTNGTNATQLSINQNNFMNYFHLNATATGNLFFISNTNDSHHATFSNNTFTQLNLNHSGSEYLIYNSSATQSFLTVSHNSIVGGFQRNASNGAMYGYYANGNSPASSLHSIFGNNFSNITSTVSGSGVFYGIYFADGNATPFPKKIVSNNVITNVSMNSSGNFYGLYGDDLGDAGGIGGSELFNNKISNINRAGSIYGLYVASAISASNACLIYDNEMSLFNSNGSSSVIYAAYLAGGGAGIYFHRNKIAEIAATGTTALVHGVYMTAAVSNTLVNNIIGNLNASNSSANNAMNGIYLNSGSMVHLLYNTVFLNCLSTSGNFNSNALYASSTVSLHLRNNILINTSSGGSGTAAAFRRSSSSLSTYSSTSNHNLFYAGTPSSSNVILQSGSTSYQTLSAMQTAVSPRDAASITQTISFLSLNPLSPNFLHITPNNFSAVESAAQNINGISADVDTQIRQGNTSYSGTGLAPDIGADEFEQNLNPCTGANAGTISPLSLSVCAGQTAVLISAGYTPGTGIIHQWKVSSVSGGPYTNVSSGLGGTSPEYFSSSLNVGTYYFILETTCTNASMTSVSQQATLVVNPIPIALASSSSSLVCSGQNIQLNGTSSNGGTYTWFGPNGFYSSSQNPILSNVSVNASGNYSLFVTANNCTSPQATTMVQVSQVTLSLTANPSVLCSGSSSTLTLSGSANSYTWSNGSTSNSLVVTPSVTTSYSITASNTANCIASRQLLLNVVSPYIQSQGTVVCGNTGTVSLSVQAFTPSSVSWYTSLSGSLSIGSGTALNAFVSSDTTFYVEAIQAQSGCFSNRIPVSITVSPFPVLSVSANPVIVCPAKTSTLTAMGAATYSWVGIGTGATRTVSPSTDQTFTVIAKNSHSCSSTQTLLVSVYPLPTISVQQNSTSVCPSSAVSFTASGAISYTWNTGTNGSITTVSPAVNTTYTVFGSNTEGCVGSRTLAVTTRSVPVISIRQSGDSICPGQLISFTATGAQSYTWLPGGINSNTFSVYPITNSVFNVIGKSINSCTQVAFALVTVDLCAGMVTDEMNSFFRIFPNPSSNFVTIELNKEDTYQINIYDSQGIERFANSFNGKRFEIDLTVFLNGLYILKIKSSTELQTHKLIKR